MNTSKMQKMTPKEQNGNVECIQSSNEADEGQLLSSNPASIPQRPDVWKQEQQQKKQMQHSQGRANQADDAPSQPKRSSNDKALNDLGAFPHVERRGASHVDTSPISGNSQARPPDSVSAQDNTYVFDLYHARVVDDESPSLSACPIVEAIAINTLEIRESLHQQDNGLLKNRTCRTVSTLTFALVVGAIVAVVLLIQKGSNSSGDSGIKAPDRGNETAISNTFTAELKRLLSNESLTALDDPASPQALSLGWLLERSNFNNWPFDRQVQRYAMATIYYATDGHSWSNGGGNWLTNETECQWFQGSEGNFCDENGTRLQYLNQSNNTLNGKMTNEIRLLSSLTVIDLSMNQVYGNLPSGLGSLTALTFLSLNDNKLSGTVLSELGSLTALTELSLGSNSFTGTVPSELGLLTALPAFSLGRNSLTGTLPSELGSLTELRLLHLDHNVLTGKVPSELGFLTALTELLLGTNRFTGTLPSEIGSLTALADLLLDWSSLTGTLPSELGSLTTLMFLRLDYNALTGTVPSELGSLTPLAALSLGSNQFDGTIPSELGSLTGLTWLSLDKNAFTGSVPSELGSLTRLTLLLLGSNSFTGTLPSELGSLTGLKWVSLDNKAFMYRRNLIP
jgi:Leucine-rich repeat (LRR) protein